MSSSIARRNTRLHSSGSRGSPQTPSPVSRIAPKPRRLTLSSPPMSKVPDVGPGIAQVGSDARPGRHAPPSHHIRLDECPRPVADGGDRLAAVYERLDEPHGV